MKDKQIRHIGMGTWKTKIIKKLHKGRSEKCGMPKIYTANPPSGGWLGGRPEDNGLKG